ncbi:MAG: TonB-dependent receptor, partial [Candidatus Marinimicrobia bacterium]|nr:TonB-dependent receptor [Candidatus Neomarinimicrobiota bacterium]
TQDDQFSPTLPEYWRWDFSAGWPILQAPVNLSATLFIQNVFNVNYWQRGDEFGVLPGAPRSIVLGLSSSW